ncbi:MAG: hypothetical protein DRJ51_02020 [Thermoprotei archaeon]|nr:MAG: hypothetical protein DRJ36_03155 [Thermoprotei archaeon]RLE82240.1 MAG: hypothetical protein DRJ51_02020 [Thermoprotei archaeon]RLF02416.1 MAG: hypothetical protein DRJ59_03655 [Thermoprotei archaeon]
MIRVRNPAVAGYFYERDREALINQLKWCFTHSLGPGEIPKVDYKGERGILGLVSPHAGYIYSGPVAAHGFYALAQNGKPDIVVLVGPNHHGVGAPVSIYPEGMWKTPLGELEVDGKIVEELSESLRGLAEVEEEPHLFEHSLEVQLPFLQFLFQKDFRIVSILMLAQNIFASKELGDALSEILHGKNFIIIASSDFTHYEPQERAERQDMQAIKAILTLEPRFLYDTIMKYDITMCGYGPVMVLMQVAKNLGGIKAKLLKYATSGDITGDRSSVVGYASILFEKELKH